MPCHRVVFSDGRLCDGFAFGGPGVQRALLEAEGVTFIDDDRVDLEACLWKGGEVFHMGADTPEGDLSQNPLEGLDWAAEMGER